jgi:hypothetical protein
MSARSRAWHLAACFVLALFSLTLRAEVYSANVAIIDGDVVRAREDALREVLREVALAGEVELRSATALVDQQLVESSLLTSRARLSEFSVVDEEIVGNHLRLSIRVEQQRLAPARCEPVLWTKNIDAVWQIAANAAISGAARQAVQLFLAGLRESLAAAYPALADAASNSGDSPYRLVAAVVPNDGAAGHRLAVKVFGADGTAISAFDDALDPDKLMVKRRESLGYADLTRWVLSVEASAQVERISRQLAATLRCLPVVARVAEGGSRGSIKIDTVAGQPLSLPAIVFYSDVFPVKADGTIDLLALKGALTVSRSDESHLYLQLPKKIAGRPYPSPGAFLWLP